MVNCFDQALLGAKYLQPRMECKRNPGFGVLFEIVFLSPCAGERVGVRGAS
jgi:hypothetical protein